jgi:hypothetical protein
MTVQRLKNKIRIVYNIHFPTILSTIQEILEEPQKILDQVCVFHTCKQVQDMNNKRKLFTLEMIQVVQDVFASEVIAHVVILAFDSSDPM